MIYDAKIPAKLFATLRTSIGKPRKMFGQWQWQWQGWRQVASTSPQRSPSLDCLFHTLGPTHCCLLARTQAAAGSKAAVRFLE